MRRIRVKQHDSYQKYTTEISGRQKTITETVQTILDKLGYGDFDIGIWFTTNKTIAAYNKEYRHKQGPTDILSFPYYTELKAGQKIRPTSPDETNLGDLIISLEFVMTNEALVRYARKRAPANFIGSWHLPSAWL